MSSAGTRLRKLMQAQCVPLPGVFNGIAARLAADTGFEAGYVSGAGVAAVRGLPDIGLCSLDAFAGTVREVVAVSNLPVIVDADTGFGEAEMVTRTVREYIAAGAAGLHIEDQVYPKRCGHLDGKELVPIQTMVEKVQRAAWARDAVDPGFILCARTDAAGVDGFEAAVERATAYVEAGADMIFPEGLGSLEQFRDFAARMRALPNGGPLLLANMTEFGKTPIISVEDFAAAGFHCVIFPMSAMRAAMKAVQEVYQTIKTTGSVQPVLDRDGLFTRQETYRVLQYKPGQEWHYPSPSIKL